MILKNVKGSDARICGLINAINQMITKSLEDYAFAIEMEKDYANAYEETEDENYYEIVSVWHDKAKNSRKELENLFYEYHQLKLDNEFEGISL